MRKKRQKRGLFALISVLILMGLSFFAGYRTGVSHPPRVKNILLVNAQHLLSADYVPEGLVNLYEQRHSFRLANAQIYLTRETYEAAERMFAAAEADNVNGFVITSGYRSYERQAEVFAESEPGYAQEPGASEHQTGLCFDVTAENVNGFETTAQYAWLCRNASKYGFIQRYPANKSKITGISYEPWHYRYVGEEAAEAITRAGMTLEEYLD